MVSDARFSLFFVVEREYFQMHFQPTWLSCCDCRMENRDKSQKRMRDLLSGKSEKQSLMDLYGGEYMDSNVAASEREVSATDEECLHLSLQCTALLWRVACSSVDVILPLAYLFRSSLIAGARPVKAVANANWRRLSATRSWCGSESRKQQRGGRQASSSSASSLWMGSARGWVMVLGSSCFQNKHIARKQNRKAIDAAGMDMWKFFFF